MISAGQRHVARREGRGALGVARRDGRDHLVGGPLVVYRDAAGAVETLVYLRQKDDALAAKYLQATAQYLEMYRGLIGPYPYGKFALVENFWETGYGMPSFTLLGPQVIRFPFILTSSYPHEILHNWWGNSVFVDYETRQLVRGPHRLPGRPPDPGAARAGRGVPPRHAAEVPRLRAATAATSRSREFRSRHSAATEAVGYGKTLMVFHMLRRRIGDDAFRKWAARFYREYRGKQASFADVREVAGGGRRAGPRPLLRRPRRAAGRGARSQASARDVRERAAAASTSPARSSRRRPARRSRSTCRSSCRPRGQPATATVRLGGGPARRSRSTTDGASRWRSTSTRVRRLPPARPARDAAVDRPDLRRAADPRGAAVAGARPRSRRPIGSWSRAGRATATQPEVRTDAEVQRAADGPRGLAARPRRTRSRATLFAARRRLHARRRRSSTVDGESMPLAGHSAVIVAPPPGEPREGGRLDLRRRPRGAARPRPQAPALRQVLVPRLRGRRAGERAQGPVAATDSPLRVDLRPAAERTAAVAAAGAARRAQALAELPPVFSQKALLEHVAWLAAPEREGRGVGTKGLDAAAEYIADAVQGDRARAGRRRRQLLPGVHRRRRSPAGSAGRRCAT